MGLTADHIAGSAGGFEPQRQNNFSLEIHGLPGGDSDRQSIILSLQSLSEIPGSQNATIAIPYQNETRYVAGKATVEAFQMVLRDYVDAETRDAIIRWRRLVYDAGVQGANGRIGLAKEYKKEGYIRLHGPDSDEPAGRRIATLVGIWPTHDPKGNPDMSADEQMTFEVTLQVDKVVWAGVSAGGGGGGIGAV